MNQSEHPLDSIRELNLSYMLLAQRLLRDDKATGMYRLGMSAEIADILLNLSPAQIVRIAATQQLLCFFRFKDYTILSSLTHAAKNADVVPAHAAIVLAGQPAEVFA
ncbi:flagellar transcriptional regulator FlhD [Trinickia terrae]|uniref:Flagellar transcriptional regulator FlhD n=1 Tax=Trinickia terrae TaxID=2571161 RepID=A0A4U1I177_9BURK|nr:flagellar transcriptional regulator FlhD [Trinickia terrae]TKC86901.1 flagellar transcriptional regulator FlhD [Trinickia terrae]